MDPPRTGDRIFLGGSRPNTHHLFLHKDRQRAECIEQDELVGNSVRNGGTKVPLMAVFADHGTWRRYLLPLSSFQLLYGRLCDIFGRKPLFIFAYLTFGLGCLFCGLARTMDELIVARALTGMAGGFNTLASIVVSDMIPLRKRGTWQGYRNLVFALGLGAGSLGGGVLADKLGWRW